MVEKGALERILHSSDMELDVLAARETVGDVQRDGCVVEVELVGQRRRLVADGDGRRDVELCCVVAHEFQEGRKRALVQVYPCERGGGMDIGHAVGGELVQDHLPDMRRLDEPAGAIGLVHPVEGYRAQRLETYHGVVAGVGLYGVHPPRLCWHGILRITGLRD